MSDFAWPKKTLEYFEECKEKYYGPAERSAKEKNKPMPNRNVFTLCPDKPLLCIQHNNVKSVLYVTPKTIENHKLKETLFLPYVYSLCVCAVRVNDDDKISIDKDYFELAYNFLFIIDKEYNAEKLLKRNNIKYTIENDDFIFSIDDYIKLNKNIDKLKSRYYKNYVLPYQCDWFDETGLKAQNTFNKYKDKYLETFKNPEEHMMMLDTSKPVLHITFKKSSGKFKYYYITYITKDIINNFNFEADNFSYWGKKYVSHGLRLNEDEFSSDLHNNIVGARKGTISKSEINKLTDYLVPEGEKYSSRKRLSLLNIRYSSADNENRLMISVNDYLKLNEEYYKHQKIN